MLSVHQLTKSFNLQTLFENVTFHVNPRDRIGVVGPNGCGKTTLMRIITGEESADQGTVAINNSTRVGYLPQGFEFDPNASIGEIIGQPTASADQLEQQLAELGVALANAPNDEALQEQYDVVLQQLIRSDQDVSAEMLAAFKLDQLDPALPAGALSGGQKTRLSLALLLRAQPDLLLLDEPTNHLDVDMLEWLEQWLLRFEGAILIISHDRAFLDNVATGILDFDPQSNEVRHYAGNYSDYLDQIETEREKQMQAYRDQMQEIKRIKADVARTRETARSNENRSTSVRKGGSKMGLSGYKDYVRSKAKATAQVAKSREKKLERFLTSQDRVEKPRQTWQMKLEFDKAAPLGRDVLSLEQLTVGYAADAPLIHIDSLHVQSGQRIVIAGPNGCGKTTLLRTIVGHLPPLSGHVSLGRSVRLGYMSQEQELLDHKRTPVEILQLAGMATETEIRNFLHFYLFKGDESLKPLHLLSYGQRARLMLAVLVTQGCNVLLLDEPINHLDIASRTLFEQALMQFSGATIAVVHDRYFIKRFASEIWWVENKKIRKAL